MAGTVLNGVLEEGTPQRLGECERVANRDFGFNGVSQERRQGYRPR
jgi:hypothetical protein